MNCVIRAAAIEHFGFLQLDEYSSTCLKKLFCSTATLNRLALQLW